MAKRLVDAGSEAGVDYVKFQTFKAENLVTRDARQAEYQSANAAEADNTQFSMLKKLELSEGDHHELIEYCQERGVKFLSTAFDMESVDFLHSLGLDFWKIPSGEISNYPYLCRIASFNEEVVLSTGMSDLDDVRLALGVMKESGQDLGKVTLLHCNTQYPTPMGDVNLRAMEALRGLGCRVGFSDHTQGVEVPVAAAALGASVIEKHFTLSHDLPGPDHKASLEPEELKEMTRMIRNVELALGSGRKEMTKSESGNREIARKSIVASRDIRQGEVFTDENLTTKRPGSGLSPMRWKEVVGSRAVRDFKRDELICL